MQRSIIAKIENGADGYGEWANTDDWVVPLRNALTNCEAAVQSDANFTKLLTEGVMHIKCELSEEGPRIAFFAGIDLHKEPIETLARQTDRVKKARDLANEQ